MDQAVGLRKKTSHDTEMDGVFSPTVPSLLKPVRVMAVSSGKGGVGKSNVVINLSLALDGMGASAEDARCRH